LDSSGVPRGFTFIPKLLFSDKVKLFGLILASTYEFLLLAVTMRQAIYFRKSFGKATGPDKEEVCHDEGAVSL
jgi:hypothetical protein